VRVSADLPKNAGALWPLLRSKAPTPQQRLGLPASVSARQVLEQPGGAAAIGLFDMSNAMRGRVALVMELSSAAAMAAVPPPLEAAPLAPSRSASPFADPK
jgi:hypothetical protein